VSFYDTFRTLNVFFPINKKKHQNKQKKIRTKLLNRISIFMTKNSHSKSEKHKLFHFIFIILLFTQLFFLSYFDIGKKLCSNAPFMTVIFHLLIMFKRTKCTSFFFIFFSFYLSPFHSFSCFFVLLLFFQTTGISFPRMFYQH
jgi:hypothetical protein